jgi:hypothetical protein
VGIYQNKSRKNEKDVLVLVYCHFLPVQSSSLKLQSMDARKTNSAGIHGNK